MVTDTSGGTQHTGAVHQVNARGLSCPLPFLLARRELLALPRGTTLEVLVDQPGAGEDMAALAEAGLAVLLPVTKEAGVYHFRMVRT